MVASARVSFVAVEPWASTRFDIGWQAPRGSRIHAATGPDGASPGRLRRACTRRRRRRAGAARRPRHRHRHRHRRRTCGRKAGPASPGRCREPRRPSRAACPAATFKTTPAAAPRQTNEWKTARGHRQVGSDAPPGSLAKGGSSGWMRRRTRMAGSTGTGSRRSSSAKRSGCGPVHPELSLRDVAVCVAEPTSISAVGPTADTVICLMRDLRSFEVHRDCRVAHEVRR